MPFDEEYFNSDDFKELLSSYESACVSGDMPFLDADDLVDIADYYNMKGDHQRAVDVVRQGLTLYPHHVLLNVFMARKALDDNNMEEAQRCAQLIDDKDSPDYHYLQAELLIAQDRIEEADAYLHQYAKTVEPDEYADFVKDAANLFVDYNVSQKAFDWIKQVSNDNSDDFKELLGRTLYCMGKYKDSQRLFNELIDKNPYSKRYWMDLAHAQFMAQDYSGSIDSSEYAIAIDPDDPEGILGKAKGLLHLGNNEQAIKYFERYSRLCPNDPVGLYYQAYCLVNIDSYQKAIPLLQQALTMDIDDDELLSMIYQELAFSYNYSGDLEHALNALEKTEHLDCDHIEMAVIRAHILLYNKCFLEARREYKRAIKKSNNDPAIILRVAVSVFDNKLHKFAYAIMKEFFENGIGNDKYPEAYGFMALCCYEADKAQEFLYYLKKAIDYDSDTAQTLLGHLYRDDMTIQDFYEYMYHRINDKDDK